jgi:hypothetical protein
VFRDERRLAYLTELEENGKAQRLRGLFQHTAVWSQTRGGASPWDVEFLAALDSVAHRIDHRPAQFGQFVQDRFGLLRPATCRNDNGVVWFKDNGSGEGVAAGATSASFIC